MPSPHFFLAHSSHIVYIWDITEPRKRLAYVSFPPDFEGFLAQRDIIDIMSLGLSRIFRGLLCISDVARTARRRRIRASGKSKAKDWAVNIKTFTGVSDDGVNALVDEWLEEQRKENAAKSVDLAIIGTSGGIILPGRDRGGVYLSIVYQLVPRSGGLLVPGRGGAN